MAGHTFECPVQLTPEDKLKALAGFQRPEVPIEVANPLAADLEPKPATSTAAKSKTKSAEKQAGPPFPPPTVNIIRRLFVRLKDWYYCSVCDLYWPPGPHEHRESHSLKHADDDMPDVPEGQPPKKQEAAPDLGTCAAIKP